MDVARAAAREAVSNLEAPIEHPMPGTPLPPLCPTRDPGRLFTRVSHAVLQAMALENRIAAGNLPPLHVTAPQTTGRAQARETNTPAQAPKGVAATNPRFRLEPAERLDGDLGPASRPILEIVEAIRQTIGTAKKPALSARANLPHTRQPAPQARPAAPKSQPPPRPG